MFYEWRIECTLLCWCLFLKINLITASSQALCISISAKQVSEKRSRAEGHTACDRSLLPLWGRGVQAGRWQVGAGSVGPGAALSLAVVPSWALRAGGCGWSVRAQWGGGQGVSSGLVGLHVKSEPLGCSPSLGVGSLEDREADPSGPTGPRGQRSEQREGKAGSWSHTGGFCHCPRPWFQPLPHRPRALLVSRLEPQDTASCPRTSPRDRTVDGINLRSERFVSVSS